MFSSFKVFAGFDSHTLTGLESGGSIEASLSGSLRRLSGSLSGCVPDCGQALKAERLRYDVFCCFWLIGC